MQLPSELVLGIYLLSILPRWYDVKKGVCLILSQSVFWSVSNQKYSFLPLNCDESLMPPSHKQMFTSTPPHPRAATQDFNMDLFIGKATESCISVSKWTPINTFLYHLINSHNTFCLQQLLLLFPFYS